ncbi:DUF4262 domain-containing protein [Mycobacterium sp. PS03-16]|uniref:DUF4262 domain-containing protein n=1 Tax=Mycobacterium sp. PS03-16 TaxID=2559611 RepID=UPI001ADD8C21|nr:DUF4262 domain-containing protein [Mycobacterium sp. PS03-16]
MCWRCDHPEATLEEYLDLLYEQILENGWTMLYIEATPTPFAYTLGLHECGLPELLVTAVCPHCATRMLNHVASVLIREDAPPAGRRMTLPDGQLVEFVEVSQPDAHLGTAVNMFGREVRALQVVWADANGRWPWSPLFNPGGDRQPVLGMRAITSKRRR